MINNNNLLLPARQHKNETAEIIAPASKSISHRMLIGAGLAHGKTILKGVLASQDTTATAGILQACGASIEADGENLVVHGLAGKIEADKTKAVLCDVNESGTTARLLTAILAAGHGLFEITGAPRMQERPMQGLIDALLPLGAKFKFKAKAGYLPFELQSSGLSSKEIEVDTSETSQYLSGLLLAAPLNNGLTLMPVAQAKKVKVEDQQTGQVLKNLQNSEVCKESAEIVSWPYALLSLQILHDFGLSFKTEVRKDMHSPWQVCNWETVSHPQSGCLRISVPAGNYLAGSYQVEGDYSNASYFLAAGAIGKRAVRVSNLRQNSLQGDKAIVNILAEMGAKMKLEEGAITVYPSKLHGIEVNMADCPDLVPTVAVLAAFAKGPTKITGVEHLRIKESDRIAAPCNELAKVGCKSEQLQDGLIIFPPEELLAPKQAFATYNDHRMAMSMALLACAGFEVEIENPGCVAKSFPLFWEEWAKI